MNPENKPIYYDGSGSLDSLVKQINESQKVTVIKPEGEVQPGKILDYPYIVHP